MSTGPGLAPFAVIFRPVGAFRFVVRYIRIKRGLFLRCLHEWGQTRARSSTRCIPAFTGLTTLAWLELYQRPYRLDEKQKQQAADTVALLLEMDSFVNRHQLLLGRDLVLLWHRHRCAFDTLAAYLLQPEVEQFLTLALGEELTQLHNDVQAVLEATIGLAGGALATKDEISSATSEGNVQARTFLEAMKEKRSGAQTLGTTVKKKPPLS